MSSLRGLVGEVRVPRRVRHGRHIASSAGAFIAMELSAYKGVLSTACVSRELFPLFNYWLSSTSSFHFPLNLSSTISGSQPLMSSNRISGHSCLLPSPRAASPVDLDEDEYDETPILSRDYDTPRPLRVHTRDPSVRLPPAPPTSRLDEPLHTQNARSFPDAWQVALRLSNCRNQETGSNELHVCHGLPCGDDIATTSRGWEWEPASDFMQPCRCCDADPESVTAVDESCPSGSRSFSINSSPATSVTNRAGEEEQLNPKHRNLATDNLRQLDEREWSVKGGRPMGRLQLFRKVPSNPHPPTAVQLQSVLDRNEQARDGHGEDQITTIDEVLFNRRDRHARSGDGPRDENEKCLMSPYEQGLDRLSTSTAQDDGIEMAPINRSVWEDDEPKGRLRALASSLRQSVEHARSSRKKGAPSKVPQFFRRLSCCSAVKET